MKQSKLVAFTIILLTSLLVLSSCGEKDNQKEVEVMEEQLQVTETSVENIDSIEQDEIQTVIEDISVDEQLTGGGSTVNVEEELEQINETLEENVNNINDELENLPEDYYLQDSEAEATVIDETNTVIDNVDINISEDMEVTEEAKDTMEEVNDVINDTDNIIEEIEQLEREEMEKEKQL